MQTQNTYGKDAVFEIMRRLEDTIQANGGFREPPVEYEPYSWIPKRYRNATFDTFETGDNPDKRKVLKTIREPILVRELRDRKDPSHLCLR